MKIENKIAAKIRIFGGSRALRSSLIFLGGLCLTLSSLVAETGIGLAEAETLALQNNLNLRVLRVEQKISDETVKEKLREYFPSVSLSYRQNRTVAQRDFDNGQYSVQLSVSQPIYDGGRTQLSYEIARIDRTIARDKYVLAIRELRFNVRKTYFELQQLRANISVTRASLETAEQIYKRGKIEHKQGVITDLDFREMSFELESRLLSFQREKQKYADKLEDFALLLRTDPVALNNLSILDWGKLRVKRINLVEDRLLELAEKNSQEIRQSRIALARSRKEYLIDKYDYLPTIALTGHYGKTGDTWPPKNAEWGVGVNATFKAFGNTLSNDVNSNRSRDDATQGVSAGGQLSIYDNPGWRKSGMQTSVELLKSRQKYRDIVKNLKIQIQRSVQEFKFRERELGNADNKLAILELRFKIEKIRFRNGESTLEKLFEEELKLIQARLDLIHRRVSHALAVNQLELQFGLELDSLQLMNFHEINADKNTEEIIQRSWRPLSAVRIPSHPIK